jgi:hypothetical protein
MQSLTTFHLNYSYSSKKKSVFEEYIDESVMASAV